MKKYIQYTVVPYEVRYYCLSWAELRAKNGRIHWNITRLGGYNELI